MIDRRIAALLATLGLAATSVGQTAVPPLAADSARRTTLEVDARGAFLRQSLSRVAHNAAGGSLALTAPGALWTHSDGGLAWIGSAVSIGDRASQVFVEYDLNNEAAELFSVYDVDPPTAVWSDPTPLASENRMVASADATDTHVAIDQIVLGGNIQTRQAVVRKYSSSSATPDWTYTFAPVINAGSKVGISRDGQVIVAALMNNNTWDVEIAVFDPSSGTPLSTTPVQVGASNYMRGFDLSADGSTLYFSAGVTAYVFDLATSSVTFNTNIGASFDSHAISGDGSVFAFGNFNVMRVWEKSGNSYSNTHTVTKPGQIYCARVDISDDGSTIAAGWYFYSPGLTVTIEALDVATKTSTMSETVTGTGSSQNVVADVSCSADGSRFAVGLWGDDGGLAHEVRMYDRDQNAPLVTFDTPGSVFDIDLSADGQRVVAGSKAVHANTFGSGGRIDLVDAGGQDFTIRGKPSLGAQVGFELHGQPSTKAILLMADAEASPPATFAGIGTLYIDRATLSSLLLGQVPASGVVTGFLTIGTDPALIGTSIYTQGLTLFPRTLTEDWAKMTILP